MQPLGWTPDDLRRASPSDLLAAIRGHNRFHGGEPGMTSAEARELYEATDWGD